ncbi:MAG: hydrogenase formation protein HypD, partial [Actinobacteria bacterium]|nr:hydrogenase formation protein HypD [Actinomycetota bacterium]
MKSQAKKLSEEIRYINDGLLKEGKYKTLKIMEVCGTHTMSIAKNGLRQLLPENIDLISGPGCPVCVTPISEIDRIIEIIKNYDVSVFTFGDLMRVPGTYSTLQIEKSKGAEIKVCYSPSDVIDYALDNNSKKIIFIAIGFETTVPLTAVLIKKAFAKSIDNFFIYSTHKTVPAALDALLNDRDINIGGFLLPGHVSAIIGSKYYKDIPLKHRIPCAIAGFEPENILMSIISILKQIKKCDFKVDIIYKSVVKPEGNPVAQKYIYEVFEPADSEWRGLGNIAGSGLVLKDHYRSFDAKSAFPVGNIISSEPEGCDCGNVLKGIKKPSECMYFAKACTPGNPIGACMVSSEGT